MEPALKKFREQAFAESDRQAMARAPKNEYTLTNAAHWFEHELRQYPPADLDIDGLKAHADRIALMAGRESRGYPSYEASVKLARKLGLDLIDLPGGHVGFLTQPAESHASSCRLLRGQGTVQSRDASHYWVLAKLLLAILATIVLLLHTQPISYIAGVAAETKLSSADFPRLWIQLVADAGAALLGLLVATGLSVYKPRSRTPYGRRKQHASGSVAEKNCAAKRLPCVVRLLDKPRYHVIGRLCVATVCEARCEVLAAHGFCHRFPVRAFAQAASRECRVAGPEKPN
jgi:hypothetical protein